MAAPKDFVTGFNHNVRHKGQGYHVQTEDSGAEIGHVITHLFQGGNILASKKTSYAELRGAPDLKVQVRLLMEEQHRQMLRQLVNGAFDPEAGEKANVAVTPEEAVPNPEAASGNRPLAGKRSSPVQVIRFAPPAERPHEKAWAGSDGQAASMGFLPAVHKAGDPSETKEAKQVEAEAAEAKRAAAAAWAAAEARKAAARIAEAAEKAQPLGKATPTPAAEEAARAAAARQAQLAIHPAQHPQSSPPLWPTAMEAAGLVAKSEPPPPPQPRLVIAERTPGPSAWQPDPQAETVFGTENGAAEKSLDQVILRYLAGERDD